MKTVTLSAHFDGKQIQLDEPYAIPSEARLLITVLPESLVSAAETIPAWKRPGPRLVTQGISLSQAVIEDRREL